uniref:Ig-like domain-containing protein n=1 Tax=Leptobrachium leishanense TaxID=445787 RepID=A0A8C5M4W9_9ANUR
VVWQVLVKSAYFRLSRADKVIQRTTDVTVQDGTDITLHCTYETADSNPYLHWYIQQSGKSPQFILLRHLFMQVENKPAEKHQSELNKTSSYLKISDVRVSDSGVYYCLKFTWSSDKGLNSPVNANGNGRMSKC